ncbi:MAG: class I SAM-dependent methyltransferase [Acidobacteriota bacterium]
MSRPVSLRAKGRILRDSVATLGVGGTLRRILVYYLTYRPGEDRSFDRRHGTDTSGLLMPPDWSFEDESLRDQAVGYVPSPARVTRAMLGALDVALEPFSFVDVGCGKGRVLLVAAELPFRQVVGVEASPALAIVARDNLQRARNLRVRCRDLRVDIGDAMTWPLPAGDLILHLYHPFGPDVLTGFLARVDDSLAREPRRLRLLYLRERPEISEVFAATSWLRRLRAVRCVDPLYSWAVFGAGDS